MNFEQYFYKYLNKKIDFDNMYNVQCVDLFNHFCENCLNLKVGYFPQYAKDFWLNRNNVKWLKDNFDFISLSQIKKGNVKKGDIGIRTTGKAGHIFVINKITNSIITYYDQNHNGKNEGISFRSNSINDNFINGILRPKNQTNLKMPNFNRGSTYKLTKPCLIWSEPNFKKPRYYKNLTADGKTHCTHNENNKQACFKADTKFYALNVITDEKYNIWVQCPSGWITVYYAGNKRAVWCGY